MQQLQEKGFCVVDHALAASQVKAPRHPPSPSSELWHKRKSESCVMMISTRPDAIDIMDEFNPRPERSLITALPYARFNIMDGGDGDY